MTHLQKLLNATSAATSRKFMSDTARAQHAAIVTSAVCIPIERELDHPVRHIDLLLDDPVRRATDRQANRPR